MDRPPGWSAQVGSAFSEPEVVTAYSHRPPYPPAVFGVLDRLLAGHRGPDGGRARVLDAGCGTGAIARHLPALGVAVDAVDISASMVEHGRALPGGSHPALRWHVGSIDEVELTAPYRLVTAGQSLHWMDWPRVLPRFGQLLGTTGLLVLLDLDDALVAWRDELVPVIQRYSTNRHFEKLDLATEIADRGLFVESGRMLTPPWTFRQSVASYVESFHGRAAFSRNRMSPADAEAFDQAVTEVVRRHTVGDVELPVLGSVVWGRPT